MLPLLLSLSCAPPDQAVVITLPAFELGAEALDFGTLPIGERSALPVALVNPWHEARVLRCMAPSPFYVETPQLELAADGSEVLLVNFTAVASATDGATAELVCTELGEPVFALTLTGATNPDADGDGWESPLAGGEDCDDSDASIHPGAADDCYDDVDANCDGASESDCDQDGWPVDRDCDDLDAAVNPSQSEVWYDGVDADCAGDSDFDADHDGHDRSPEGADCDDTRSTVNPDVSEVWYDGLDADCSGGSDYDQDLDGLDAEPWGLDCDDSDAAVLECPQDTGAPADTGEPPDTGT